MGTAVSQTEVSVASNAEALAVALHPQAAGMLLDRNPTIVFIAIGHARLPTIPIGFITPVDFALSEAAVVAFTVGLEQRLALPKATVMDAVIAAVLVQLSDDATADAAVPRIAVSTSHPAA
jgi:hypothetical protein